ncbi:hypothetical protein AAF712_016022 [Marasmius tenuissimus]|uniref:Uncharacterized protein n=1 Tax=Marasmius tenuissimus TaxID=585030 RepID=A0ABR2ZA48_9AGAR
MVERMLTGFKNLLHSPQDGPEWIAATEDELDMLKKHAQACVYWKRKLLEAREDEMFLRFAKEGWSRRELTHPGFSKHPSVRSLEDAPYIVDERNWPATRLVLLDILRDLKTLRQRDELALTVKQRRDMLRTVYEPHRRQMSRLPEYKDVMIPPFGDCIMSPHAECLRNLIEDSSHYRTIPAENFRAALAQIDLVSIATEYTRTKEDLLRTEADVTELEHPGSVIFRLPSSTRPETDTILFSPRILADPFFITNDANSSIPGIKLWALPPAGTLEYDPRASWYAGEMLRLCGATSMKEVEMMDPLFECLDCRRVGKWRSFLRWIAALKHHGECHILSITSFDEAVKLRIEQAEVDLKKGHPQIPYRAVKCSLCPEYPAQFDRLNAEEKCAKVNIHGTIEDHLLNV